MAQLRDGSLFLERGERLVFPVPRDHPLSSVQEIKEIASIDDVRNFAHIKEWLSAFPGRREPGAPASSDPSFRGGLRPSSAIIQQMRNLGSLLRLRFGDFTVPVGTTVVLQNPFSEIVANKVTLQGLLEVHGELSIVCNEITGV